MTRRPGSAPVSFARVALRRLPRTTIRPSSPRRASSATGANIGVGYDHPPFDTLIAGQTYDIQGWTIVADANGIRFTHDGTGHGMFVGSDTTVDPF